MSSSLYLVNLGAPQLVEDRGGNHLFTLLSGISLIEPASWARAAQHELADAGAVVVVDFEERRHAAVAAERAGMPGASAAFEGANLALSQQLVALTQDARLLVRMLEGESRPAVLAAIESRFETLAREVA